MNKTWGKHLIVDAYGIDPKKLKDWQKIKKLLGDLPIRLKMRVLQRPSVKKVKTEGYPDWGISGFTMLYESHVSLHTWPEEKYVAMDIYSCRNFDEKETVKYLKKYWGCSRMKIKTVVRG